MIKKDSLKVLTIYFQAYEDILQIKDCPVYFVSLDLLHAEIPVQVWSHFPVPHLNIGTIYLEDPLTQQRSAPIRIRISTLRNVIYSRFKTIYRSIQP